jgi:hypothetical protein
MVREHRIPLINKIEYWTGVHRGVVRALVDSIADAAERLQLHVETKTERTALVELTTYATTLSMNYLTRGSFVPRVRQRMPEAKKRSTAKNKKGTDGQTQDRDRPQP